MRITAISLTTLFMILGTIGCNSSPQNTSTATVVSTPTPSPTPYIATWERKVQTDELKGIDEDWYTITAIHSSENSSVYGPLGNIPLEARIALLCKNHKFVQGQFEPRLSSSLDFDGYRNYAIPARLDEKTMHTFHWGLADSGDSYMFGKPDLRFLLQYKKAVIGVTAGGHQVALKFDEIPQPDSQMNADCGLGSTKQ